jgi:bifunctional enzyme CysN/CysC
VNPELRIDTVDRSPDDAAEEILDYLRENGFLGA